ncbi:MULTISPECIES: NAD(P)/FAD-dependent oxidoreductase [Dyella]|uniref:NAD(P)/FAD-dependent oxidoreductase n=1 Tax=Dyella TaxID=231454 RepID=UPI000C8350D0|nr:MULTISPECIES: NAD(P)/FAD-dependent oxidoreductase [Dyella]MDR3445684.1 NAD(P)/FAD-dependent oxidoreductase [Dyella sp.]PMQ04026.1 3-oxosteroid 1-dehydrogenase [Dyella sp. AD56]ULU27579.1 NAD(P)/FAD-dependent oxidoreductase [Dyella terrae]
MKVDVLIIGAGAAGLMCAIVAGQRGRSVLVVDHANKVGKKILMSGGGRCNFTNTGVTPACYLSANPHFAKSALARYTPWDFIAMVEKHRIAYHEKELGQLFCDESSKLIVRMLLDECAQAGVRIETSCGVQRVRKTDEGFSVITAHGEVHAQSLVVATGGLSIPTMGATGFGYELARQFGHAVLPTRAGLVPLTLSGKHQERYHDLSGVALPMVEARVGKHSFRAGMLFTHRGVSGPAILQISSYWQPGDDLRIDLSPALDLGEWLQEQRNVRPAAELKNVLGDALPRRLAQRLCELWFESKPMRQYREAELKNIGEQLHDWPVVASGTEGYRTAEVTLGGVDTDGLSSSTMQSKLVPGLYFVGEVVDVTGWLGGYNFQWAWASGHAAGEVV